MPFCVQQVCVTVACRFLRTSCWDVALALWCSALTCCLPPPPQILTPLLRLKTVTLVTPKNIKREKHLYMKCKANTSWLKSVLFWTEIECLIVAILVAAVIKWSSKSVNHQSKTNKQTNTVVHSPVYISSYLVIYFIVITTELQKDVKKKYSPVKKCSYSNNLIILSKHPHTHTHIYTHTHMHTYTCACTHAHVHTHTHTH